MLALVRDDSATDVDVDVEESSREHSSNLVETVRIDRLDRPDVVRIDVIILDVREVENDLLRLE